MIRFCVCSSSAALVIDSPGTVGMYSSFPSYSGGMNSVPIRPAGHTSPRHDHRQMDRVSTPTKHEADHRPVQPDEQRD